MAWPAIHMHNEEAATPENMNRPLAGLAQRTEILRRRVDTEIGDKLRRSTRFIDVKLDRDQLPAGPCIVYWDAKDDLYREAVATVDLENALRDLDNRGYAAGILVQVDVASATGTVVVHGYVHGLDIQAMLEDGQTLVPGPLWLSSVQPGRFTIRPSGPSVYIGIFDTEQGIVDPQYRDFAEAHVHRGIVLAHRSQGPQLAVLDDGYGNPSHYWVKGLRPLSAQEPFHGDHTGANGATDLVDTGAGFAMDDLRGLFILNVTKGTYGVVTANNTDTVSTIMDGGTLWDTGDQYYLFERARLVVEGPVTDASDVVYQITLTDASGLNSPPIVDSFDGVYFHWESSDPEEGTGLVPVHGYDQAVLIGTRGFRVRLENMAAAYSVADPTGGTLWASGLVPAAFSGLPEGWGQHPVGFHDEDWRRWRLDFPSAVQGWRQHEVRAVRGTPTAPGVAVTLRSENYDYDARTLQLVCGHLARVSWGVVPPEVGSQIVVGDVILEFNDGGPLSTGATPVEYVPGDTQATMTNAITALIEAAPVGVWGARSQTGTETEFWVIASDLPRLPALTGVTNLTVTTFVSGTDPNPAVLPGVRCMLLDDEHRWIPHAAQPYGELEYWNRSVLGIDTGLSYYARPYGPDGAQVSTPQVQLGSVFTFDVTDVHALHDYEYTMDLDPAFSSVFPPQPRNSGVFMWGGEELPSTTDDAVYGQYTVTRRTLLSRLAPAFRPWHADAGWSKFYLPVMRAGDTGIVRTLRAAEDSGITVKRCGTNEPASVGDLELDFELRLSTRFTNLPDWNVVKGVRRQKLLTGPVVSKIRDGTWYSVRSFRGAPRGHGEIELVLDGAGRTGGFSDIALENGKTDVIGMFPYIKLLPRTSGIRSGFVARFAVPWQMEGAWAMLLDFHAFGLGDTPAGARRTFGLDVTYNILRAYDPAIEAGSTLVGDLVESAQTLEWSIPLGTVSDGYKAYAPMIVHTDPQLSADDPGRLYRAEPGPFPRAGDLKGGVAEANIMLLALRPGTNVAIRFENAERGPVPYDQPLGIMNLQWRLVPLV